jgi:hypothetical protein
MMHQRVEALRARHVEVHQDQIGIGMLHRPAGIERFHAVGLEQQHARHHPLYRAAQGFAEQGDGRRRSAG